MQTKQFTSEWDSLLKYQAPEWFRDAKFGIWAHWGPQSVPMAGDWYARNMFIQGSSQYKDHLERYGHPSEHGYRELIDLWKCEKWKPDELMKLYKETGAKYFVSMGVHHDNFDLWNSKYHDWNATKYGPHRDVVGEWQSAAKRNGLKFGVSEHLGASYTWWKASKESDKTGSLAGVPYEGANPKYQDLYHPLPEADDKSWYSTNAAWHKEWSDRISDLVTNYKPDLLYSDGGFPFGTVSRKVVANLYNQSFDAKGKVQAVYLAKDMGSGEFKAGTCVTDRERGAMAEVSPVVWQTDTSVGDWFYNKNWPFRKPKWIIHTLVDVVSKNGNLLLNVVQRPDGSLDADLVDTLRNVGAWLNTNGESIYGTRPWLTFGEGPTKVVGGHFKEDFPFNEKDIRFARKGKSTLYATLLGAPKSRFSIESLALYNGVKGQVKKVECVSVKQKLSFRQDATGLHIDLPDALGDRVATVFKITCNDVLAFRPDLVPKPEPQKIVEDAKGRFDLLPDLAEATNGIQVETKDGKQNFGFWDSPDGTVSWNIKVEKAGTFEVSMDAGTEKAGADITCSFGKATDKSSKKVQFSIPYTASWSTFVNMAPQMVELDAGTYRVVVSATNPLKWTAINMRGLRVVRMVDSKL